MSMSDDAFVFGMGHFPSLGSTLSFGGDHAEMEITPRARAALDELLAHGYAEPCEPLDGWPNREHYRALKGCRLPKDRPHLNPFAKDAAGRLDWVTFRKKGGQT